MWASSPCARGPRLYDWATVPGLAGPLRAERDESVTVLTSHLPKCEAALAVLDADDDTEPEAEAEPDTEGDTEGDDTEPDTEGDDTEAEPDTEGDTEGDDTEPEPFEVPEGAERVAYLENLTEYIDGLEPAEYAELRAELPPETLAALGLADDDELEALGLSLTYAGELPSTLDEMALAGVPWSTSRKVLVFGGVAIVAGTAGWWLWQRYKARKAAAAAWPGDVPGRVATREAPTTRPAVGLQDMAAPMPRPWSPGDPEPEALP
jgi:hypothetical protein